MQLTEIRHKKGYQTLVRVGLVSYGLIHLLVAWLALQVAFGKKGDTSNAGALKELAKQPLGAVLLWVMAVGLLTLTVWQVIEAVVGRVEPGRDGALRKRLSSAGRALVYLGLGVLAIRVAMGGGAQSGGSEEELSARLMSVPFGRVLVGLVGAVVIAVGVSQIVKGVKKKFTEDLAQGTTPAVLRLGMVGYCAKGVSLAVIGLLFGWAAVTYDPQKAGGMDAALSTIRGQPFGTVLLVLMAAAIACFGLFCFAWARRARF